MKVDISKDWKNLIGGEFSKPYFLELEKFVDQQYADYSCYPDQEHIFAAFTSCTVENLKVVIIGQDPYHGPQQANGLCFAVNEGITHPPSLKNIFKELSADLPAANNHSSALTTWASQGVLLLNSTLTVRQSEAASHQKQGWEKFTDAVISIISDQKEDLVFLLWGGAAQKKGAKINREKHLVLNCGHPSPLSANRGFWFGNKHFSQTNAYLIKQGLTPIQW